VSANSKIRRPLPGAPLHVLVLADDPLVRDALLGSLAGEAAVRVIDSADQAHVALLDPGAPSSPSSKSERGARARLDLGLAPIGELDVPSVVLAESEAQARAALARGARGAVMRKPDGPRLVAALHAVAAGLTVLDFSLSPSATPADESAAQAQLTGREHEVLELLAAGCSNRRIARKLGISEHTAKFHVNGILVKLSAGTRTEAVVIAARRGLVML
jgi:two-component system nitrate/nitrite response regulator NarL